jgi:hypothetical protein
MVHEVFKPHTVEGDDSQNILAQHKSQKTCDNGYGYGILPEKSQLTFHDRGDQQKDGQHGYVDKVIPDLT